MGCVAGGLLEIYLAEPTCMKPTIKSRLITFEIGKDQHV